MNDHQVDQLIAIGKDVFDALVSTGKIIDIKRKRSVSSQIEIRRTRRCIEDKSEIVSLHEDAWTVANTTTSLTRESLRALSIADPCAAEISSNATVFSLPDILMVKEGRPYASTIETSFELNVAVFNAAGRWAKRLAVLGYVSPSFWHFGI